MNTAMRREEFMGQSFEVDGRVLNPRPETELLVETGLCILKNGKPPEYFGEPPRLPVRAEALEAREGPAFDKLRPNAITRNVLDLGTGSGCVAVSISLFEPSARVTATDLSNEALEVARDNARRLGLEDRIDFRRGDLFEALGAGNERFDLILSNPPYIAEGEWDSLPANVLSEPRIALWGGRAGLETMGRLIDLAPGHLAPGGWLALEIGHRQAAAVRERLDKAGLTDISVLKDFSGIERIAVGRHG